jgi:hypothetical protein
MSEMSPLLKLVLAAMRVTCLALAMLLVLIIGVFLWSKHTPAGFVFVHGDWGMLAVLGTLIALSLYLARGAGRELNGTRPK